MKDFVINFLEYSTQVYECIDYPAGEMQIRIRPQWIEYIESAKTVTINAALAGVSTILSRNIIGLLLLTDAIRAINPMVAVNLNIPYLPYSRGDRRFVDGDCHGLATFASILNLAHFDCVTTLDVHHQPRANMFVSNLVNKAPASLIVSAISNFESHVGLKITVLFPDAGAEKRYRNCIPTGVPVRAATKKRNVKTGAFDGFTVPPKDAFENHNILIVDDICDGGGTFLGISDALQLTGIIPRLGLYITHGIFSGGFEKLSKHFEQIYTTNSICRDVEPPNSHISDSFVALLENSAQDNVLDKRLV